MSAYLGPGEPDNCLDIVAMNGRRKRAHKPGDHGSEGYIDTRKIPLSMGLGRGGGGVRMSLFEILRIPMHRQLEGEKLIEMIKLENKGQSN